VGHKLVVEGVIGALTGLLGLAPGVGRVDPVGEIERELARDEAADQGAAVAQDRGPQELGRQVLAQELGQRVALGDHHTADVGEPRRGGSLVHEPNPSEVAGAQDRPLAVRIGVSAVGLAEPVDLGAQLPEARQLRLARIGDRRRALVSSAPGESHVVVLHRVSRNPNDGVPGRHVVQDDRVGADLRSRTHPYRADDLRPGPNLHTALERRPVEVAGAQADRDERSEDGPRRRCAPVRR
jgi:hypothetical protein